jgi:hypothetical protein
MSKFSAVAVVVLLSQTAFAQMDAVHFQNIVSNINSSSAGYSAGFKGRYNADGEIKGNVYLDSSFRKTNIYLYKTDATLNSPSRYNLLHNEFEVETTAGVRSLSGAVVKQFILVKGNDSTKFLNGKDFSVEGAPLEGFVGILADGEARLAKQIKIEIVKPSYNPSLEVGDRNTHVLQKPVFYIQKGEKELVRIKNAKSLSDSFGNKKDQVSKYIKQNKLDLKEEVDLVQVFNYYNSLQ